jgi:hypothetical protein
MADVLSAMLKLCPDTVQAKRDRALLALGFVGVAFRSERVALAVRTSPKSPMACACGSAAARATKRARRSSSRAATGCVPWRQ